MGIANLAMGIIGMIQQGQQRERNQNMEKLNIMSNLFQETGTPEAYQAMQEAGKNLGMTFPDLARSTQARQTEQVATQPVPLGAGPTQQAAFPSSGPQSNAISKILGSIQPQAKAPIQAPQPTQKDLTKQQPTQALSSEEEQLIGPARSFRDTASEVAQEMGLEIDEKGNPTNILGGEPLRNYRKETFTRHRTYLKERDTELKQMRLANQKEKRDLAMEEKKEKARFALESERERAKDERQAIRERKADERQAKREAAAERRTEGRAAKDRKKLQVIYGPGGKTRMVSVSSESGYVPPEGWSLAKPSREDALSELLNPKGATGDPLGLR